MVGFLPEIPLVVSYYTKGTPYEEEVKGLKDSCKKFGIECHIEEVESKGSWEENCAYKPYFMREMMQRFQRPLLWVDADAVFLRPLVFDEYMFADFSIVKLEDQEDVRFYINSATVYVNATVGGMKGLDLWCHFADKIIEEEKSRPAYMDQVSLHLAFLSKPSISIATLPITYCKIFDKEEEVSPEDVVIEQRQASRRLRNLV